MLADGSKFFVCLQFLGPHQILRLHLALSALCCTAAPRTALTGIDSGLHGSNHHACLEETSVCPGCVAVGLVFKEQTALVGCGGLCFFCCALVREEQRGARDLPLSLKQ